MTLKEKKEKLAAVRKELDGCVMYPNGWLKSVGSVFFIYLTSGWVMRDVVYYGSIRHGLNFEVLSMASSYFVGSKEHAQKLCDAYGGTAYPTEYCHVAENPRELWAWEGPRRLEPCAQSQRLGLAEPLDYDEVVDILF